MVRSDSSTDRANGVPRYEAEKLGAALPWKDGLATLLDGSPLIKLEPRRIVWGPGERIDSIYVLQSGLLSLLSGDHRVAVETGTVGHGGLLGSSIVLGATTVKCQAIVLLTANAWRIPAAHFLAEYHRSSGLRSRVNRDLDWQLFQARQNALCHSVHSSEQRFCRWVLCASDAIGKSELPLTQDVCARALGLQRTTVATTAHALQLSGLITTRRGRISIKDRSGVEARACACWNSLRAYAGRAG